MTVKLAIVFYSTYGTNHRMAEIAAEAARAAGAEVRLLRVTETAPAEVVAAQDAWKAQADKAADLPIATPEDMEWANAYLFSAPTRFGAAPSQLRAFIDSLGGQWFTGKLANKPVSAMSSAQNPHGGQEATILGLYTSFLHWGAVIAAPGYTDQSIFAAGGNPYGYSHTKAKSSARPRWPPFRIRPNGLSRSPPNWPDHTAGHRRSMGCIPCYERVTGSTKKGGLRPPFDFRAKSDQFGIFAVMPST